jgi:hypothetical protein
MSTSELPSSRRVDEVAEENSCTSTPLVRPARQPREETESHPPGSVPKEMTSSTFFGFKAKSGSHTTQPENPNENRPQEENAELCLLGAHGQVIRKQWQFEMKVSRKGR